MQVMPADDEREHEGRAGFVVRRDSGQHEDAGADDGADAQARQPDRAEYPLQAVFPLHLLEELVQGFRREELFSHANLSSWLHRGRRRGSIWRHRAAFPWPVVSLVAFRDRATVKHVPPC